MPPYPNSSARVKLRSSGIPSTGPASRTRTFPLPMRSHPKEANLSSGSRDPSLAALDFLLFVRHSFRVRSPPGVNSN